jgi:hypothetical protein
VLFRIGRAPEPWLVPFEPSTTGQCNSENRFDDSNGRYAVLYASSTPLGCFIETLARFRKAPPSLLAELNEIEGADADQPAFGTVPASWLSARRMGRAVVAKKRCADIYCSEWLSHLRRELESDLNAMITFSDGQFDLSDLMSRNRRVSQRASTRIHDLGDFAGIYYQSRHGRDLYNWALFEPFALNGCSRSELRSDDSAFHKALELLDLTLDPRS